MPFRQKGFTLIELVVVIVILGLLAAVALPRFVNLTSDARLASLNGVAGGLRSAVALARAQYIVTGDNNAVLVSMDAQNVTVFAETAQAGHGGKPTADAAGIGAAMPDPSGYLVSAGGAAITSTRTYTLNATCFLTYDPDAADVVALTDTSGC